MNPMEALKRDIELALPEVETTLRRPRNSNGNWWLDASCDGHRVAIQWSPRRGFGLTSAGELGAGYGEGPEEVFEDRSTTAKRVIGLLKSKSHTVAPPDVVLRELRGLLGVTQEQLAGRLGVQQAAVSRLERRSDITLSSLRRYVAALGGQLEINIRTATGEQVRLVDPGLATNRRASCVHVEHTISDTAPLASPPSHSELDEWLDTFQTAARSRWDLGASSSVAVHRLDAAGLAWADTDRAQIAINSRAASCLSQTFLQIAQTSARDRQLDSSRAVYRYLLAHELGHFVQASAHEPTNRDPLLGYKHAELRADAFAGWLAGHAGEDSTGAVIAGLLGCRVPTCMHPNPEQRSFAYLAGHFEGLQDRRSSVARMSLIVLRVGDLEISRSFYTELGLRFASEQHNAGPVHYSCTLEDMVLELYPRTTSAPPAALRFGIRLALESDALDRLRSSGLLREPPRLLRTQPDSTVYLVKDPDGNAIELVLIKSRTQAGC